MQNLFKSFVVAMLIALPSISLGQEPYSLQAGGGEQPMSLLTTFAEDVARGDMLGSVESGTELLSMASTAVASDPQTQDEGYLTAEQIVRLYLEAYPNDLLYHYFKEGGGKVLIKSFSWGGVYWSYHWSFEIHFDNSWADTEWNREEAVRHLRNHLLAMADENGSAINVHLETWDGDINKFLTRMSDQGIPLALIFSPKQITNTQLEDLNQAAVSTVKLVPYFGGYVMAFELASGQVLSFTVYGERELTTTEKWVIIGTPAAGYVAGILVKVGGKWVFRQLTKRADDLAQLAPNRGLAGAGGFWKTIDEVVDPSVVRQLTPNACGNACGEMLLRGRGITQISQANIAATKGLVLSDAPSLASALRKLHPEGKWLGDSLDVFTNPRGTFGALNNNGPFIASIKSYGSNLHMVVVDGLDDAGRVIIRDPWGKGTRYLMDWDDFAKHWQSHNVWWGN